MTAAVDLVSSLAYLHQPPIPWGGLALLDSRRAKSRRIPVVSTALGDLG